jgi:hypothetical protein
MVKRQQTAKGGKQARRASSASGKDEFAPRPLLPIGLARARGSGALPPPLNPALAFPSQRAKPHSQISHPGLITRCADAVPPLGPCKLSKMRFPASPLADRMVGCSPVSTSALDFSVLRFEAGETLSRSPSRTPD